MKVKIVSESGLNLPEWYDECIGQDFEVHSVHGTVYRVELPRDLYVKFGQFQYYVPVKKCAIVD